jgi:2-hydroxychromene-2-carboxylate isomerase
MRGAVGLQLREGHRFEIYAKAMFNAIWVTSQNLNDPAVTAAVLQDAGFDPAAFMALVSDAEVKEALKTATQQAVDRQIFGAPTMFVGDQMFWGQDRLDFVKEALG